MMNSSSLKLFLHNHYTSNPNIITYYNHKSKRLFMPLSCCFGQTSKNDPNSFNNLTVDPPPSTSHPPSVDPKHVFTGNFAPVDELGPTECPVVVGKLPDSLTGTYIRNGPNPQHIPNGPLHFFEGDGMLHSLNLSNGCATYTCRYVKTYKYKLERDAGGQIFPNMLTGFYGLRDIIQCVVALARVLLGHLDLKKGFGLANTSLAFLSSKLLALGESDLPYILNITQENDIETLGRWDFDNKLFSNMTAHPKFDMITKETFAFKCSPIFPYLTLFKFDPNGVKQNDVPILSMKQPSFIHDFAITKRFAIFSETQLTISVANVMLAKGMPVVFDSTRIPRIGIISKYATSDDEMKWLIVQGFNAMHVINAWEENDDEIVLIAPNVTSIEDMLHKIGSVHFSLEKVTVNLRRGEVSRKILSKRNLEMGSINSCYIGKKNRYVYMGVGERVPRMQGLVKIDLEKGIEVSRRLYGAGCFGGEPLFVPRSGDHGHNLDGGDHNEDEDDGFVVTYVHDENSGESRFVIMDAKSPNLDIVAAVVLPRRVPYGFHGLFVHAESLMQSNEFGFS